MGFSLTDFTCRYPNLLLFESAKDLEDLTQEVHDYGTTEDEELPKAVKELTRGKEGSSRLRPDIVWGHLREMTTLEAFPHPFQGCSACPHHTSFRMLVEKGYFP